jgi:ATP-dependent DNA helicase RecG
MSELSGKDIKFLSDVGPKKAAILNEELDIHSFEGMLYHFPYKYIDRTKFYSISELNPKLPYIQVKAEFVSLETVGEGKYIRLVGEVSDETGVLELIWFKGIKFVQSQVKPNTKYVFFGKPSVFNGKINIVHPEIDSIEKSQENIQSGLQAFYPTTEKMKRGYVNSKTIGKFQANIFNSLNGRIPETLPEWFIKKHNLLTLHESLLNIHFPQSIDLQKRSEYRLKFEELFYIQLNTLKQRQKRKLFFKGMTFGQIGRYFNAFYNNHLPFELTGAQKRVIKEIRKDCGSGKQMNRLLQGDVGSGKTLVALMSMLIAIDNNYQACIMAPTEILAKQHLETLHDFLKDMNINIALLTGSTKKKEREIIHENLRNGNLNILIGTHALLEDVVQFNNLGFVVIDEQHRFGVGQRAKLWSKSQNPPHILVMTATPIPRTLAMTLYGDLDISIIDELPPGRKPIQTSHIYENRRQIIYDFMRKQLELGRQIYLVYPLIKESEKLDIKNLEDGYQQIFDIFSPLGYKLSMLHGKMKAADKDFAMQEFAKHETHIMVATTVIEVGVNVPNATIMIIENAERFGLSQLHQLRGRVGRGGEQSYCLLATSYKLSKESRMRIDCMVGTNDGFEIAEADLKLRGFGDIEGTQQSGISYKLKIAHIGKDSQLLQYVRDIGEEIIEKDALLEKKENFTFAVQLKRISKTKVSWSSIS